MTIAPRKLRKGQRCEVRTYNVLTGQDTLVLDTDRILLEAPNWNGADLILNGDGQLWKLSLKDQSLARIEIEGIPDLNNDHVLDPDGTHIYLSANEDYHIYRAPITGGAATKITPDDGVLHFLHGVSPDGNEIAYVGLVVDKSSESFSPLSAEIQTLKVGTDCVRTLTKNAVADGPEYSPDGNWIYFNAEVFSGHAQIGRMRRDGTGLERLTYSETVDWFPHLSPDGKRAVYLAYPPGTQGHPSDLPVQLMLVADNWQDAKTIASLFGGQGTINVNSWSPDSSSFAYVAYPIENTQ